MATYISINSSSPTTLFTYVPTKVTSSNSAGTYTAAATTTYTASVYATSYDSSTKTVTGKCTITSSTLCTLTNDSSSKATLSAIAIIPALTVTIGSTEVVGAKINHTFSGSVVAGGALGLTFTNTHTSSVTFTQTLSSVSDTVSIGTVAMNPTTYRLTISGGTAGTTTTGTQSSNSIRYIPYATCSGFGNITWSSGSTTPDTATQNITITQNNSSVWSGLGYQWCWKVGSSGVYVGAGMQTSKTLAWTVPTNILTSYLTSSSYLSGDNTKKTAPIYYQIRTYLNSSTYSGYDYASATNTVTITNAYAPTGVTCGTISDLANDGSGYHLSEATRYLTGHSYFSLPITAYTINTASGASFSKFAAVFDSTESGTGTSSPITTEVLPRVNSVLYGRVYDSRGFYSDAIAMTFSSSNAIQYVAPTVLVTCSKGSSDDTVGSARITLNYTAFDEQKGNISTTTIFSGTSAASQTITKSMTDSEWSTSGQWTKVSTTTTGWITTGETGDISVTAYDLYSSCTGTGNIGRTLSFGKSTDATEVPFSINKIQSYYHIECDYITPNSESDTIDTGIYPDDTTVIRMKLCPLAACGLIVGYPTSSESDAFRFFNYNSQFYLDYGSGYNYNRIAGGSFPANVPMTLEIGNRYVTNLATQEKIIYGTKVSFTEKTTTIKVASNVNFYWIRIYKNNQLVSNLIPCFGIATQKSGFYDTVSNSFKYSDTAAMHQGISYLLAPSFGIGTTATTNGALACTLKPYFQVNNAGSSDRLNDYVVAENYSTSYTDTASNSEWNWRIWASGYKEQWKRYYNSSSVGLSSYGNGWYYTSVAPGTFPIPFTEIPAAKAVIQCPQGSTGVYYCLGWAHCYDNTTTAAASVEFLRPNGSSTPVSFIAYYCGY